MKAAVMEDSPDTVAYTVKSDLVAVIRTSKLV